MGKTAKALFFCFVSASLFFVASCQKSPAEVARALPSVGSLYQQRISDVFVEAEGVVIRILQDDTEGARHQRFILRLDSGQTLLISHNIDLAKRIDSLKVGDKISFRGAYVYNEKGGLVHWTHHDPSHKSPGGWIIHHGITYR